VIETKRGGKRRRGRIPTRDERYIRKDEFIGDVLPWCGVLKGNTMERNSLVGHQPAGA
jgi:hypothetical protein